MKMAAWSPQTKLAPAAIEWLAAAVAASSEQVLPVDGRRPKIAPKAPVSIAQRQQRSCSGLSSMLSSADSRQQSY
ncbi:hypothetical protein V3C99_008308 [Haemonchus contortus]